MEQGFSFNKDAFVIRAVKNGEEGDQYMITLGNQVASPKKFDSYEEAEEAINNRDWDLIACLSVVLAEHTMKNIIMQKKEDK